ncbi:MAG: antibiotic biosynthesis monooxygenase [Candidatus Devosia phytovorans]|uniref:Antibiotic biosynthesis monooxygenase n=1 Tax=Candidatus Devosia phytovorans TaxID=3121372 RepID=A0AAJ6AY52_9HYPH|nr:antibiotic biosynthesis monooxygenase [Devosia sp.]WEK03185.1 MAG: antibiotic biosynthesis monooxygenase [Devosia sp.]
MSDTRLARIAELEIDPDQLGPYLDLLTEEITTSLAMEPGVLMLNAVALKHAPHQLRLLELYASREAYEAHIQTPHFVKYKIGTAAMVRNLRLVDVDPILLAARELQP